MKKIVIILLFIAIVFSYQNTIFASFKDASDNEDVTNEIEWIFKERAKIWNEFLSGKYSTILEIEEELKHILIDPLLRFDIEMFEQLRLNPSSYEGISNVSVVNISKIKNNSKNIEAQVTLTWEIEGFDKDYSEDIKYFIHMEKVRDRWLLKNYEVIE